MCLFDVTNKPQKDAKTVFGVSVTPLRIFLNGFVSILSLKTFLVHNFCH